MIPFCAYIAWPVPVWTMTWKHTSVDVKAFKIQIKQEIIDDLRARLTRTRWPDEAEGAGWTQGASLSYMKELINYWLNKFDWRAQERQLNSYPQFKAKVKGWNIHFVHARGKGPKSLPLLICHGWPDNFARFLKLVPYLTDQSSKRGEDVDSFDVVIPSLPGYGFSDSQMAPPVRIRI